jgi:hypothetical protein
MSPFGYNQPTKAETNPMNDKLINALQDWRFIADIEFDAEDNIVEIKEGLGEALRIEDDMIYISLEHAHTAGFVGDYSGEFRGGLPYIHEDLESIVKKFSDEWIEWNNPGQLSIYAK